MAIHKDKFQDYMRLCFCEELSFLCSRVGNCWCLRQKSCLSHFAPSWTSNLQTRWAQNWELWAATWFTEAVNINFECNYFQYIHAVFYDIYVTQEIILESWFLIFAFSVCPAWWANSPSFMLRMISNSWGCTLRCIQGWLTRAQLEEGIECRSKFCLDLHGISDCHASHSYLRIILDVKILNGIAYLVIGIICSSWIFCNCTFLCSMDLFNSIQ